MIECTNRKGKITTKSGNKNELQLYMHRNYNMKLSQDQFVV